MVTENALYLLVPLAFRRAFSARHRPARLRTGTLGRLPAECSAVSSLRTAAISRRSALRWAFLQRLRSSCSPNAVLIGGAVRHRSSADRARYRSESIASDTVCGQGVRGRAACCACSTGPGRDQFIGKSVERLAEPLALHLAVPNLAEQRREPLQLGFQLGRRDSVERLREYPQRAAYPADRHPGVVDGVGASAQSDVTGDDGVDLVVQISGDGPLRR